jgi:hypothetical protein
VKIGQYTQHQREGRKFPGTEAIEQSGKDGEGLSNSLNSDCEDALKTRRYLCSLKELYLYDAEASLSVL